MKPLAIKKCAECGKDVEIFHKERLYNRKNFFCSRRCMGIYTKKQNLNTICPICGKSFHKKAYSKTKCLNNYCSIECHRKAKMKYMKGEKNHQYGLKGKLNASWKSDKRVSSYGYILVRCLEHPFRNEDDMVFEHRLIAEKYLLNDENSVEINGKKYLKNDLIVHHKDGNKKNNSVDNLEIMTLSEHTKLHLRKKKLES